MRTITLELHDDDDDDGVYLTTYAHGQQVGPQVIGWVHDRSYTEHGQTITRMEWISLTSATGHSYVANVSKEYAIAQLLRMWLESAGAYA